MVNDDWTLVTKSHVEYSVRSVNKHVLFNNDTYVCSRVSVPSGKETTNPSRKSSPTSTRNRFTPLQSLEVSDNPSQNKLGEGRLQQRSQVNSKKFRLTNDTKNESIVGKKTKRELTNANIVSRKPKNSNPTGNIWDQASLNLNTLFQAEKKDNINIGIWNAESVRQKESLIREYILDNDLDVFIILESWLFKDELPYTVNILPNIDGYKLHQMPRLNRKSSSGGGMLCIY